MLRSVLFLSLSFLAASAEAGILPSLAQLKAARPNSEGRLLAAGGEVLQEQRVEMRGRYLGWLSLSEVSPALVKAILHVEDRNFYSHGGVDYRALASSLWQNLRGHRRGASTITMQTVNFLDEELSAHRGLKRGLWQKIRQGRLAWELEESWSKEQILEAYLNLVSFRGEFKGILAASRGIFGKDPHGLNEKESYLLASLLRAPGAKAAVMGERLCRLKIAELGNCAELLAFSREVLGKPHIVEARGALAPHLARRLLSKEKREVRTFIHADLQSALVSAIGQQMQSLQAQNVRDAAAIVVENKTGRVIAYVGGAGQWSASPEVNMAQAKRQAGSTLKPLLYGLAFEKKILQPDSWLLDEPFEIPVGRGTYRPENYDHSFRGPEIASTALASSLNIPAVRVIDLLGVEPFRDFLAEAGFRGLESADFYGPSLALGSADVALEDLVSAYQGIANGGRKISLIYAKGNTSETKRIFSVDTADSLAAILSDRDSRAPTFGWDGAIDTPYSAAVKTGTSKDMRDNWCVGFTRDYTVGVWVGNSGGDPMWQVSGVEGAAPIWRVAMDFLHRQKSAAPLPALAAARQTFQAGFFGRILYPSAGDTIALDRDIPSGRQRLPLEADTDGIFQVDGVAVPGRSWEPVHGKHRLSFHSIAGKKLDEIAFEVR